VALRLGGAARRLSEVRVSALLDTLCTAVSARYQLASRTEVGAPPVWLWTADASGAEWTRVPQAEDQLRRKELENYCVRLVADEYEEELTAALRSEEPADLDDLLCKRWTKACRESARTELRR